MVGMMKPVKLLKYTVSKDANGDMAEVLEARYRMWAEVEDAGGNRTTERGSTKIGGSKRFLIHFRPDWVLNGDWRVRYYGKEYRINGIERIDEKRFNWRLSCSD